MKVGKAAASAALASLVLLGTAGGASALTLDLSGIGGLVKETTGVVDELLGGAPTLPGVEAPAPAADVDADRGGIHIQVGDVLDVQVGVNAPATPALPPVPAVPAVPAVPGVPATPSLPETGVLPAVPVDVPSASIPEMPDPVRAFSLISFWSEETRGMATSVSRDGQETADTASSFAHRAAGMTVDLAGLGSIRLMVASAYQEASNTAGSAIA